MTKELVVEQRYVGMLIGRAGETLRQMEEESGAKIYIDQSTSLKGYSTLRASGGARAVTRARGLVEGKLKAAWASGRTAARSPGLWDAPHATSEPGQSALPNTRPPPRAGPDGKGDGLGKATEELKLKQSSVRHIIGMQGETRKAIELESGARLDFDQTTRDVGYSTLMITGTGEAIRHARRLVADRISCATGGSGGEPPLTIRMPQQYVGLILGKGGETLRNLQDQSCTTIDVDQATRDQGYSVIRIRPLARARRAKELMQAKIRAHNERFGGGGGGATVREERKINQDLVRLIVGKCGETIKQIQQESGAHVYLDQSTSRRGYSTVQLTGSRRAVDLARVLVADKTGEPWDRPPPHEGDAARDGAGGGDEEEGGGEVDLEELVEDAAPPRSSGGLELQAPPQGRRRADSPRRSGSPPHLRDAWDEDTPPRRARPEPRSSRSPKPARGSSVASTPPPRRPPAPSPPPSCSPGSCGPTPPRLRGVVDLLARAYHAVWSSSPTTTVQKEEEEEVPEQGDATPSDEVFGSISGQDSSPRDDDGAPETPTSPPSAQEARQTDVLEKEHLGSPCQEDGHAECATKTAASPPDQEQKKEEEVEVDRNATARAAEPAAEVEDNEHEVQPQERFAAEEGKEQAVEGAALGEGAGGVDVEEGSAFGDPRPASLFSATPPDSPGKPADGTEVEAMRRQEGSAFSDPRPASLFSDTPPDSPGKPADGTEVEVAGPPSNGQDDANMGADTGATVMWVPVAVTVPAEGCCAGSWGWGGDGSSGCYWNGEDQWSADVWGGNSWTQGDWWPQSPWGSMPGRRPLRQWRPRVRDADGHDSDAAAAHGTRPPLRGHAGPRAQRGRSCSPMALRARGLQDNLNVGRAQSCQGAHGADTATSVERAKGGSMEDWDEPEDDEQAAWKAPRFGDGRRAFGRHACFGDREQAESHIEMKIEQRLVGWLIGRGGVVINSIARTSGARVQLDQDTWRDGYSILHLTGSAAATAEAKHLAHQCLAEAIEQRGRGAGGGGRNTSPPPLRQQPLHSHFVDTTAAPCKDGMAPMRLVRAVLGGLLGQWYADGGNKIFEVTLVLTASESGCGKLACRTWQHGARLGPERSIRIEGRDIFLGERDRMYLDAFTDKCLTWVHEFKSEVRQRWNRNRHESAAAPRLREVTAVAEWSGSESDGFELDLQEEFPPLSLKREDGPGPTPLGRQAAPPRPYSQGRPQSCEPPAPVTAAWGPRPLPLTRFQ